MRRSILCLTAIVLASGLVFLVLVVVPAAETAVAQEPREQAAKTPPADRYAVPETSEVTVLVTFVKGLKSFRPELGPDLDEHEEKLPTAIRKACERILALDRNENSEPRYFASREMLSFRMTDMAESEMDDFDQRKKLTADCVKILKASDRTAADAELATSLATTFEDFATDDEALSFYQLLGDLFVRNTDTEIAQRGEFLEGAARRLGIVGEPFEVAGRTIDDRDFELKSLQGKVVLIDFWATWCGHCMDELPHLKRNYQTYHDRGFEIVGISVDDDREALQKFLKKQKIPWTTLHDEEAGAEHPAATHYGIAAYPTSFLLDRTGRVVATDLRGRKLGQKLAELCGLDTDKKTPFPIFSVGEVIDKMTVAGSRLYKSGKAKGDVALRKNLDRQTAELHLPEPREEVLSDRELYRRVSQSVFIVCSLYKLDSNAEWQTSLATAFAVTSDGVLTSSGHVFDNEDEADAIVVMDVNGKVYPVRELLAINKQADTCLFRIDASNLEPLPYADDAPPGTRVWVMGHPGDSFYFFSHGLISNYDKDPDGIIWMNTTADFGQGSSGGPVVDERGNVVGQVSRTFTLYAGGPATRGRPRRVAGERVAEKREKDPNEKPDVDEDVPDPQMVFKSCVPVKTLRSLVKPKKIEAVKHSEK
ncbi:MAG: Redoxin domain protein [Schlesneria sp.]|nr:Redoxin domain protein [Schlesneria sp.]